MLTTSSTISFEKRAATYQAEWLEQPCVGTYYRSRAPAPALRAQMRDYSASMWKEAAIGGEQESGFEKAFSSLAYAYLKDKAPRLIDYIIGFQLIDRNEDNTKAVGVFGIKVGDQWLYAPIFFLNGDLKGHELLYLKKQDAFIPMKENWVNYLISRKPHVLGKATEQDTYQLGGMPPDLYRLSRPPISTKYSADAYRPQVQEWAKLFLPYIGAAASRMAGSLYKEAKVKTPLAFDKVAASPLTAAVAGNTYSLSDFLASDITMLKAAHDLTLAYPLIRQGFDKFYGTDFFHKTAMSMKEAEDDITKWKPRPVPVARPRPMTVKEALSPLVIGEPDPVHPMKDGSLRVLFKSAAEHKVDMDAPGGIVVNLPEMDDEEREKLLNDGVLIKDKRDPHAVSVAYNTQVRLELTNPYETGIYEVLEKPGSFDRMLIAMHPQTNARKERWATVVRLSDPRNWLNTHHSNLFVKPDAGKPDRTEYTKWYDGLSDSTSLEKGGHYMGIGPRGDTTTPFKVREVFDKDTYQVDFNDHCEWGQDRPKGYTSNFGHYPDSDEVYISTYDAKLWINNREGSSMRSVAGELSVPSNFKFLKIKDPPKPKKQDVLKDHGCCMSEPGEYADRSDKDKPVRPGNLGDVQTMLYEKTASLTLLDLGGEVNMKSRKGEQRLTKLAALVDLVTVHGFSEYTARQMLKEAAVKKSMTYRVKYAEPFSGLQPGPGAPAMPPPNMGMEQVGHGAVNSIYPQEQQTKVPELAGSNTDPKVYDPFYEPDRKSMQFAQQASQSGQKEVFDTAMISGLLKGVRQDSLVDKYLGDLMKALDKLGRILFLFYWHQEEFEERYGKQDLPELEDALRNAFEAMGDVTLFLKEKQVGDIDELGGVGNPDPSVEQTARN